jgi:cellobiose phosphorylase
LLVEPSIPAEWSGYKVTRKFRNATYQISVSNPQHVSTGVNSMLVDGKPVAGNLIPAMNDGQIHMVDIIMG